MKEVNGDPTASRTNLAGDEARSKDWARLKVVGGWW